MMLGCVLAGLAGGLGWTFFEYGMHAWNGHGMKGKTMFSRGHLQHHKDPSWFAPLWQKLALAVWVVPALGLAASALVGWQYGVAFAGGFAVLYAFYESLHMHCHTHAPKNAYSRWVRRHHLYHHFHSSKMNHGVTTPFWDVIFRTYVPVERVRVPESRAMVWLCDESGHVKPDFAGEYELIPERRTAPAGAAAMAELPSVSEAAAEAEPELAGAR